MMKILLFIFLLPLMSFGQEVFTVDTKDIKVGVPVQAKAIQYKKFDPSPSSERITLLFESNINYAPIGLKLIFKNDSSKLGGYITAKISEDFFLRDVNTKSDPVSLKNNEPVVDMNELIFGFGAVLDICKKIDFYLGSGIMAGPRFVPGYLTSATNVKWNRTTSNVIIPMASFGVIMDYGRLKFAMGNETAFTTDKNYQVFYYNTKSFGRLSSFTFGVGYTF